VAKPEFSPQTMSVLAALSTVPDQWRHGYDIAKETGLKSGTLYPILIRLADRDIVEARWETEQPTGRPRRHLYRLTATGVVRVRAAQAADAQAQAQARALAQRLPAGRGQTVEGLA
jgi:PadR family transcriptional regulator PadR